MSEPTVQAQEQPTLTWKRVWLWIGILYGASLFGFLIKVSAQMGGLVFKNIWQALAVALLPAIHMFWFGVIAVGYLAVKKFNLPKSSGFLTTLAWLYVIFVAFQLISGRKI